MPSPKRVHWAQLRVGLLAIGAMLLAAVLVFLITSSKGLLESTFMVRTYVDDAGGVSQGSPVRLNGILVGSIERVRFSGSKDLKRAVEVAMTINRKFMNNIPQNSLAGITASNLLGDKYLNITMGDSPVHIAEGGEIPGIAVKDIPELINQASAILFQIQTIVGRADRILAEVEGGKGNIGKFLKDDELYKRLNSTAAEVQALVSDVRNSNGTISKLIYKDELYTDVRAIAKRVDDLLARVENGDGSAAKLINDPELYNEAQAAMIDVRQIIDGLKSGKGTAGKLLTDEQLHAQLNQAIAKVNFVLDKINSGQGTIGQLLVNPQLYDSLNLATTELNSLIKDVRANPKKFLHVKLAIF